MHVEIWHTLSLFHADIIWPFECMPLSFLSHENYFWKLTSIFSLVSEAIILRVPLRIILFLLNPVGDFWSTFKSLSYLILVSWTSYHHLFLVPFKKPSGYFFFSVVDAFSNVCTCHGYWPRSSYLSLRCTVLVHSAPLSFWSWSDKWLPHEDFCLQLHLNPYRQSYELIHSVWSDKQILFFG